MVSGASAAGHARQDFDDPSSRRRRVRGLPNPVEATRYHSLIVERDTLPDALEITAETDDGLIMGLRHREREIEGVQFHPESVLTSAGHALITNFIDRCR